MTSPTRRAFAIAVRDGFTAPMLGKKLVSTPPARAIRSQHQGPDLYAHRGDGRGLDHVVARDPGRRTELGLSVHVDPGHDLYAAGTARSQPGLGSRRVHAVRGRSGAEPRRRP